jgi:hypothetical protein
VNGFLFFNTMIVAIKKILGKDSEGRKIDSNLFRRARLGEGVTDLSANRESAHLRTRL